LIFNMNYLSIDYGTRRVGLAYTINNIIFTLPQVANNDKFIPTLKNIIKIHTISKIYIGLSQGKFATITKNFISKLEAEVSIPIETVEEAVSTIEAHQLKPKKSQSIDSIAAAIILNRAIQ